MTLEELRLNALKCDEKKYLAEKENDWLEFKASWNKLGEDITDYAIEHGKSKIEIVDLFVKDKNYTYQRLMLECFELTLKAVAARISEERGATIDSKMIQLAIMSNNYFVDGIQTIQYVVDRGINILYSELRNYDFMTVLGEITLNDIEVIDLGDFPSIINEKIIKVKGQKWVLHKNDADPFPSNPHAHNYESGLKLDLSNGKLYNKKTEVKSINKKSLVAIRGKFESFGIEMPPLTI